MKKLIYYILFIFLLLIPITKVEAFVRLKTNNQSPLVGSQILLNLEINFGETRLASAAYEIEYDPEKFEYAGEIWSQSTGEIDTSTKGFIIIRKRDDGSYWERGDVAIIRFDVLSDGKSKIDLHAYGTEGSISDKNNNIDTGGFSGITFNIKQPDTTTRVGTIYVEGYTISPTFNQEEHNYNLTVPSDVESVNVVAKPINKKQTITGAGTRKLIYGDNLVKIVVTAQNGDTDTYRIMITRQDDRSTDTALSMLNVSNTDIRYEEGKYEYEAEVPKSIDKIVISAKGVDPKSTITGMGEKSLEFGKNVFEIELLTASGHKQKYKFTIIRSTIEFQNSSTGTKLQSLTIEGNKIDVQTGSVFSYLNKEGKSELQIDAVTRSVTAKTVITGNDHLKEGPNTITITVIESNGNKEDYKIHVYNFANASQEINTFDINFDPINENKFFIFNFDEEVILPEALINSIKKNDYIFSLGFKDGTSIPYVLKVNKKANYTEEPISIKKVENKALPTYNINLQKDQEVNIFVGDIFQDGQIVRIYSYDEEDKIRELSPGTQIVGGYITFNTNEQHYYVLTVEQLIKVETTIQDYIDQYKEVIAYSLGGILVLTIVVKILQYIKIRSKRKL